MSPEFSRRGLMASAAALAALPATAKAATRPEALAAMKRATAFMTGKVANRGGYVWSYLPDLSRRWGEMEAYPSMIWIQPPGTGTMGHLFLDAYHATGDETYYDAAVKSAEALVAIQHPKGGWNYLGDFAGDKSIRRWYDTIGKNGWRLEEFQHYYGNATFDDAGTSECSQFLLRLYLEKKDARFKPALDRAINFVLDAQYPNGGWPQRWPKTDEFHHHGLPDYTGYITFNDDVAGENLKFLIMVWQTLADPRALPAIRKAMDCFIACQQPKPQPAWGLQHSYPDLKPAGARTYEPKAFTSHTTAQNLTSLMDFYVLTGETRYLARIPEALDWLAAIKLPDNVMPGKPRWPTFIEVGTNEPLYVHRRGSNVVNGEYYVDKNPAKTVVHYSSFRNVRLDALQKRYATLKATAPEEASKGSPLKGGRQPLPKYFTTADISVSDLNVGVLKAQPGAVSADAAGKVVAALNKDGYWPTELKAISHPYTVDGSATPAPGDFSETRVGDMTDTSPYVDEHPRLGISTGAYIENMATLIRFVSGA